MKSVYILLLFSFFSLITAVAVYPQECYYVRSDGNDNNNGLSENTPFKTLAMALEKAREGNIKIIKIIGLISGNNIENTDWAFNIENTGSALITITGESITGQEGHVTVEGTIGVISIGNNTNILFQHITISGGKNAFGGGIAVGGFRANVTLGEGVKIVNNNAIWGAGVGIYDMGTCVMSGGEISENNAEIAGGGVYSTGLFIMTGGIINNNHSDKVAGGLFINEHSECELRGGKINRNFAPEVAGVYIAGSMTMVDGEINGNQANFQYGGVIVFGTLIMNGGSISFNQSMSWAGIGVLGNFIMNDGEISGNYSYAGVGGVSLGNHGIFIMNGGKIYANHNSSNQSNGKGGAVTIPRGTSFVMNGGQIAHNQAYYGGGVYVANGGNFTISNGEITQNQSHEGGGVYIETEGVFTITGGMINNNGSADGKDVKYE